MPSPSERVDRLEDGVAALRVDADGRLVEQQQARPVEQADADVQAPLHAAAERRGAVLGPVREADELEHLVRACLAAPRRPARTAGRRTGGSRGRSGRGRSRAPGGRSRCRPSRPPRPTSIAVPSRSTSPPSRVEQPADHRDRRRLARAVRAEQAVGLALVDLEADPADGLDRPVSLAQVAGAEHDGGHPDHTLHGAPVGRLQDAIVGGKLVDASPNGPEFGPPTVLAGPVLRQFPAGSQGARSGCARSRRGRDATGRSDG